MSCMSRLFIRSVVVICVTLFSVNLPHLSMQVLFPLHDLWGCLNIMRLVLSVCVRDRDSAILCLFSIYIMNTFPLLALKCRLALGLNDFGISCVACIMLRMKIILFPDVVRLLMLLAAGHARLTTLVFVFEHAWQSLVVSMKWILWVIVPGSA